MDDKLLSPNLVLWSMNLQSILLTATRFVAAVIMLQTLAFKFTASEESVYIFTQVGMEPWGRIGVGMAELLAAALLLYRRYAWIGGTLAAGLMLGAVGMHITLLGIDVKGDGGYLFFLALAVLGCSFVVLLIERRKIKDFILKLRN